MNKWDQRYTEPGFAYGTKPNDFLVESANQIPEDGSVLCLAEGEGRNSVFLASQGYSVTAVDSSAVGMKKSMELAAEQKVHVDFHVADLTGYHIPKNSYDAVVSIFCHLMETDRKRIHKEAVASLKPGGVFILEAYTPRQLDRGTGGPPVKELLMELEDVKEELSPLQFIHAAEVERDIVEGRLHTGTGSVVQIIAKKIS